MIGEITNTQEYIDSRDIIKRIEYLEIDEDNNDEEEKEELKTLKDLADQCNYGDWDFGATLIHDDYFAEYAQSLAEDIGAVSRHMPWPTDHIDWDSAAESLQMDYTAVDFDGETYWLRS